MLFPVQVDATRSEDEVFSDVCTIFGDLPKLEKKRRKKCKDLSVLHSPQKKRSMLLLLDTF